MRAAGRWHPVASVNPRAAELLFRHKVLSVLAARELLTEERIELLDSWKSGHTGFSAHHAVTVRAGDGGGLERLARYLLLSASSPAVGPCGEFGVGVPGGWTQARVRAQESGRRGIAAGMDPRCLPSGPDSPVPSTDETSWMAPCYHRTSVTSRGSPFRAAPDQARA